MPQVSTTKLSSRGQVVIPEEIRNAMHLHSGDKFLVLCENDVIILKTISPSVENFKPLINKIRKIAKEAGLTKDDVQSAIKLSRKKY